MRLFSLTLSNRVRFNRLFIGVSLVLFGIMPTSLLALDDTPYTDPTGQITTMIPSGWADESTAQYGLFTKEDVSIYLLSVPAVDVQEGIAQALAIAQPQLAESQPAQSGELPVPNGTWTQNLYALPDGSLVIGIGYVREDVTLVMVVVVPDPAAINSVIADINSVLLNIDTGETVEAPEVPEAAAASTIDPNASVELPAPTGAYSVGRRSFAWLDETRDEVFTEDPDDHRELAVWVWYPADISAGDPQPAPYLPSPGASLLEDAFGFSVEQIINHAYEAASISDAQSTYPVLVFSHGSGLLSPTYAALLEEIASHGYIIFGIDHPYNALFTQYPDGRVVPASTAGQFDLEVEYWSADQRFVLDQLEALNAGDDPLAGRLDLSRIAVFGHSFGGASAAETCLKDTRCDAALNIDGSLFGGTLEMDIPVPFMQILSDHCAEIAAQGQDSVEDCEAAIGEVNALWRSAFEGAPTGYLLQLEGAFHLSFADSGLLAPVVPALGAGVEAATLAPDRVWQITSSYALAFFGSALNGVDSPLLDAPSESYPEVNFEVNVR